MARHITCKVHDKQERIKALGVEGKDIYSMIDIWNEIHIDGGSYYTFEQGKRAFLKAVEDKNGVKYLTTHPDGITPNNLDELKRCSD